MRPGSQFRGMLWSVEREKHHTYKDPADIIDEKAIFEAMESTKEAAKDVGAVSAILEAAKDRSFLTNYTPGAPVHLIPELSDKASLCMSDMS